MDKLKTERRYEDEEGLHVRTYDITLMKRYARLTASHNIDAGDQDPKTKEWAATVPIGEVEKAIKKAEDSGRGELEIRTEVRTDYSDGYQQFGGVSGKNRYTHNVRLVIEKKNQYSISIDMGQESI